MQRQVGEWLFAGNYLGNKSTHLWTGREANAAVFGTGATLGNINQRRVLYLLNQTQGQYYGTIGRPRKSPGRPTSTLSSPPMMYKHLVITGAHTQESPMLGSSGDVRAWDARTGKLVWTFHTVPRPGEAGHETWEGDSWKDRSGANVWSMMTVDVARGLVFLPLGSPTYDYYGGDRKARTCMAARWSRWMRIRAS